MSSLPGRTHQTLVLVVAVMVAVMAAMSCVSPAIRLTEAARGCYLVETRIDSEARMRLDPSGRPVHGSLQPAINSRPPWQELLQLEAGVAPRQPMGADRPDHYVARFSSDPPGHPELAWWAVIGDTIQVVRGMGFGSEEYWLQIRGDTLVGRGAEMTDAMWYAAFAVQGHRAACVRPNGQAI